MKIVYHHRIASKDGQYVHLDAIVTALRDQGHDVHLVGPRIVEQGAFGGDGGLLSAIRGAVPAWAGELLELGYNLIAFPRLLLAVARDRPSVVYERYNLFSFAGVWTRRLTGRPLLLEVNAPLAEERARYGGLRLERLARACEKYVWRSADAVLPVTGVLGERVTGGGVAPEHVTVIPNGCHESLLGDEAVEAQPNPFAEVEEPLVLGFCGFLRSWHGLESVLDVMRQPGFAGTCFLVVGDGPAREPLEERARELGLAHRLHVTGTVAHAAIPSWVRLFDVALQPEVVDYASPLKLFDYMAMGCAIVAPNRANIREILTHEVDALLFEPGDVGDLQRALERLLDEAPLRDRLGVAARNRARERDLTWEGNARRIAALAERLLEGARPGRGR